jgi:antirestriction protein ArdC
VRKGEHGTRVVFVKRLRVIDKNSAEGDERLVPLMREYTVFNVAQCEGLPLGDRARRPDAGPQSRWPRSACR